MRTLWVCLFLAVPLLRAADGQATLTLTTRPPGAGVALNDVLVGRTPLVLTQVPAGDYLVTFERDGCLPLSRKVSVGKKPLTVEADLPAQHPATLTVEVKPDGAEVLLDGDCAGHTPLKLARLLPGAYELEIRRPNFESFSKTLTVAPDAKLVFAGIELKDKTLAMLRSLVETQPQRIGHYLGLGHYLFVCGQKDEAARAFKKGYDAACKPLDFDGPGYLGRKNMSADEMAAENKLRQEESDRFFGEVQNSRYNDIPQIRQFVPPRKKPSWPW